MKNHPVQTLPAFGRFLLLLAGVLAMGKAALCTRAQVAWTGADLANGNTNWSDGVNWNNGGSPGSPPTTGDAVVFGDTGAVAMQGQINNLVDASFTAAIGSLIYTNNAGLYQTTLIPAGQTLVVGGATTVGAAINVNPGPTTTATITGPGALAVGGNLTVGQGNTSGTSSAFLDMSGLNLFSNNLSTATLSIGAAQQINGTLNLATNNFINVATLNLEATGGKNGRAGILNLGPGTNVIEASTFQIGEGKATTATVQFSAAAPASAGVSISGTDGSPARSAIIIAYDHSESAQVTGNLLLAGHSANVLAGTLTIGQKGNTSGSPDVGNVTFDHGTFDVTTVLMGVVTSGTPGATGNFIVGGDPNNAATLIVNSPSGPGGGSFVMGDSGVAGSIGAGNLTINTNGVVQMYCGITKNTAGPNTATISINGGRLNTEDNAFGAALDSLSLTNATLTLPAGVSASINATTLAVGGATNTINVSSVPLITSYPTQVPLVTFTTLNGTFNFALGTLPSTFQGFISNNTRSVDLVITNGPPPPSGIVWSGRDANNGNALSSTWDIGITADWLNSNNVATTYNNGAGFGGDLVTFNDNGATSLVTLAATVSPSSITVSNSARNYTINDNGAFYAITSPGGLDKEGSGSLLLDNAGGMSLAGSLTIGGGTVQVGNGDGFGALGGNPVINNGAVVFDHSASPVITNNISGAGSLTQEGGDSVTLSGNNSFTGAALVTGNSVLQLGSATALGGEHVTTVTTGSTLDLNGFTGAGSVVAQGGGVNGNGAVNNSSATIPPADRGLTNLTLTGDTSIGTTGNRWDLRSPGGTTGDPGSATLSTGGQPYNLTKVGAGGNSAGFFGVVSATVDTNLANIDVQQGIFEMEGNTTGLGNPTNTLTVESGATFELYRATNQLNKVIVIDDNGTLLNGNGANTIVGPVAFTNNDASPAPYCNVNLANGAGYSLTLAGPLTGNSVLNRGTGTNLLVLSGNSPDFAGGISINIGSLTISGTLNNALGVSMSFGSLKVNGALLGAGVTNTGGTLTGFGVIGNSVDTLGTVAPGDFGIPGTLTVGGLVLEGGAQLTMDLNYANTVGGGTNDLIVVNGDVTINGNTININPLSTLQDGVPYRLVNYTGHLIWNSDPSVVSANNYNFTLDTNTPGQINLIASGGPPIWNGGSATDNNWSDAANWGGVTLLAGSALYFDGNNRLNNLNDTAAGNTYGNIGFVPTAGAFVLNGNPIVLGGNGIVNDSTNVQTINIPLAYNSSQTFDGGSGGLNVNGGLTNTANLTTLALAGTGALVDLAGNLDGLETNSISMTDTNGNWTLVDNPSSASIAVPWVFSINAGTFNFGSGASAPNLTSTTARGVPQDNQVGNVTGAAGALNMVKGTLTLTARLNTATALNSTGIVNQVGGTLNIADQFQGANGGNLGEQSTVTISGGTMNIGPATNAVNQFYVASRGNGMLTVSGSAAFNCGILDISRNASGNTFGSIGVVNLDGGVLTCSQVGTATANQQAGPPSSGQQPSATFNFNGGTLKANASSVAFFQGKTASPAIPIAAIVRAGGANIDSGTNSIAVLEPLQHDATLGSAPDGGLLKLGGGTLTIGSVCTYNGPTVVNNGTLAVNGSLGMTAVTVATNGTLTGRGSCGSNVTVSAGGTIAPAGAGVIGTLTVASNVTLMAGATAALDLNAATLTNDVLNAGGTISYGGALTVTNLAGAPAAGNRFKLFNAASYAGSFDVTNLPALNSGLGWNWDASSGTLSVVSTTLIPTNSPGITGFTLAGANVVISGTNAEAGATYYLLASTNVAMPLGQWTAVATNVVSTTNNFTFIGTNVVTPGVVQQFYILSNTNN